MTIRDLFGEREHYFVPESEEFRMIALGSNHPDRNKALSRGRILGDKMRAIILNESGEPGGSLCIIRIYNAFKSN